MPERYAAIAVLIMEHPTCLDCIASKNGLDGVQAQRLLDVMGQSVKLHAHEDRCDACGTHRTVFSMRRP